MNFKVILIISRWKNENMNEQRAIVDCRWKKGTIVLPIKSENCKSKVDPQYSSYAQQNNTRIS